MRSALLTDRALRSLTNRTPRRWSASSIMRITWQSRVFQRTMYNRSIMMKRMAVGGRWTALWWTRMRTRWWSLPTD